MPPARAGMRRVLLAFALAALGVACLTAPLARAQHAGPPPCLKSAATGVCYPNQAYVAKYLVPKRPLTAEDRLWQLRIEAASACSRQATKGNCELYSKGTTQIMCHWDDEAGYCSGGITDTLHLFREFSCPGSTMAKALGCLVNGVMGKCPPTLPAKCFWKNMEGLAGRIELRCIDDSIDAFSRMADWWASLRTTATQPEQWKQQFGACAKATALMKFLQCEAATTPQACSQLPHCQDTCHLRSSNTDVRGQTLTDLWLRCAAPGACSTS